MKERTLTSKGDLTLVRQILHIDLIRRTSNPSLKKYFQGLKRDIDGWLTCDFTSFLTVFKSYQDNIWMITKGCVQWNTI